MPSSTSEWMDLADDFREYYFNALCWAADLAGVVHLGDLIVEGLMDPARQVLTDADQVQFDEGRSMPNGNSSFLNLVTSFVDYALSHLAVEGDSAGNFIEWVIQRGIPALYIPTAAGHSHRHGGSDRLNELHRMPYTEYLYTPEWKRRREVMLEIAEYRCQACNRAGGLHVHHRTYERRGFERKADLIVLCADCHQVFHDHRILSPMGKGDS